MKLILLSDLNMTTRRDVLGLAALALVMPAIGGRAAAQLDASPRIRRNASAMSARDPFFEKYAEAVRRMHELPQSDARNWRNQALIHLNHCPHGDEAGLPHFLHWHRHYITHFERICGELIGDREFALAYWDWEGDGSKIPDAFYDLNHLNAEFWNDRSAAQSPNWPGGPVNTVAQRSLRKGQRMSANRARGTSFSRNAIQNIRRATSYPVFSGGLEAQPHNATHVLVGGSRGHMGSGLSPLDPIFWLHHCNVDRLWAEWQGTGNETPDPRQNYDRNFVDAAGARVERLTARSAIDMESLGYTYDTLQHDLVAMRARQLGVTDRPSSNALLKSPKLTMPVEIGRATVPSAASRSGEIVVVPVQIPALLDVLSQTRVFRATEFLGSPRSALEPRRIVARLHSLAPPPDLSAAVSVFVNCPYLGSATPITDEHCAGVISFFAQHGASGDKPPPQGHGGHAQHKAQASSQHGTTSHYIDITAPLRALAAAGRLDSTTIQLQMRALTGHDEENTPALVGLGSVTIIST